MNQIQGHMKDELEQRYEDNFQENYLTIRLLDIWRNAVSPVEAVVTLEQMRTVWITDLGWFAEPPD